MKRRGPALCPVCRRQIPLRGDGRLRAHLARPGQRGGCDGSGMFSARVEELGAPAVVADAVDAWAGLGPAQVFNAVEAWRLVDALWFELEDMRAAGCAPPRAVAEAEAAVRRAVAAATELAPWWAVADV